jgi:hypothetical protein
LKPLFSLKSYKQQTIVLSTALVVVLLVIFQVSIRRTISVFANYRSNAAKISMAANAPARIASLQKRLANTQETSMQPYNRERLLEKVTDFCRENNLLIRSFPEGLVANQNENKVVSNQIEVEGGYKDMVRLAYLLEMEEKQGSISSLKFYLYKDRVAKRTVLRNLIVLRNLES